MHSNMTETSGTGQCHVFPRPLPLGKVRNPRPGPLDTVKRTEATSVARTETSPREPITYSGTLTVDTRKESESQNLHREFDKIHRQFEEKGHLPPPSLVSGEKAALPALMDELENSRTLVEEPQLAKEASLADEQRPLESAKTPDVGLLGPPSTPPHLERELMEPCERGEQMDGSGDADQLPLPSLVREDDVGDVVGGVKRVKWNLTNGASSHHGHGVKQSDSVKSKLKPHWSSKKDRPRKKVVANTCQNVFKNFLSSTRTETTNSSLFLKYFGDRNPTVNMQHLQGELKDALRRIPLVVLRRLSPDAVEKHAPQSRVSGTHKDKYEELTVSVDDAHCAERPSVNGKHNQARAEKAKPRKQEKISPLTEMLEQSKVWGNAKHTLSSSMKDSSKTADSVPSGRRLDVNSNNQIDVESHSLFSCDLVDPKVASLSKTLRLACSNGKAADQIAFKKKKVGVLGPPSPKPRSASSRPGSTSPKPGAKKAQPFIVDKLKLHLKLQGNQTKTSHTANTAYTAHSSSALKMSFIAKSKSSTSSADDRLGGRSFSGLSADVPCKEPSLDGWESRPDVIFDCGGPATKKFPTQNEKIAVSSEDDRGKWKTGAQAQKLTRVNQDNDNTSTPSNTTTTTTTSATNNIQPIPTDPACLITCIEKTSPALVIPHREEKVVVESDMIVMQNYYYGRLHSTAPSADRQTVVSGCCVPPSEGGVEDAAVDRQTVVSGFHIPPSEGGVEDVAVDRQTVVSGCCIPPSEGGVEDVAVDRQSIVSGCRIPSSEGGAEGVIAAVDGQDGGSVDVGVTAAEVLATPVAQPLVVQVEEVAELPKPKDSLSNQAHLFNAGILMINTSATACRTLPSKLSPARQRAYFRSVSDEGDDGKGVGAEYRDIELATVSVKLDPCLCSVEKTSPVLGEASTATAELADSVKIASQAEEVVDTKVPFSAGEACLIQVFSGTGEAVVVKGSPTTVGGGESGAGIMEESFVLEQPVLAVTKEEEQEPAAATTEEFQIGEFISSTFDVVEEQVSTSEELTEGSTVSQDVITTTSITTTTACEDQITAGLLLADFQDEIVGEIEITQDEGEDVDEVFQIVNERDVPIPHEAFLQSLDLLRETERLGTDSKKASPARFSRSASPLEGSVRTSPLRESVLPSSVGQSLNSALARESVFMSLADKGLLDMPLSAEKSAWRKAWLKDDGIEYDVLTTKTTKDSRVGEENEDSDATLPYPRDEHDARTKKTKKSRTRRSRKKTSKKASNEKKKTKPSSEPQPPRVEISPGKKNYPKRGRTTKSYNKLEEFSPIIPTTRREKKQKGNNTKGAAKRHPLFKKRNQSATKQPRAKQKPKAKASETKPKTSTSPLKLTIPTTSGTPSTPTTTFTTSTTSIPLASSSAPLPADPRDSVYSFSDSSTDSPLENLPPKPFFSDQLSRSKSVPATKRSSAKKRTPAKTSGKGRSTIAIESVPETTTAKRRSRPGQGKRKKPKSAESKTPSEEKARLTAALFGATTLTDEDSESDELPTILPPKRRRQQLQQQQQQQQQQQLQHNQQQQLPHCRISATTTTTTAAAEALASSQAAAEVAADMQERSMVDPQGSDRIMREFPRHNWLQYKILHKSTTSYTPPSASASLASLSPPPASFATLNSADLALALPSSTHLHPPVAEGVGEGLDLRAGRSSSRNSRNDSPERAKGLDWTDEKLSSVANARNGSTKRASGDDSNLTVSSADTSSKTGQASNSASEEAACVRASDGLSAKELEASSATTSVRGAVSLAVIPGSTPPPPVPVPRAGQPGNPAPGHAFSFSRPITDLTAATPAPPFPVSYTPRTPLFVRPDVANSNNSSSGVSGNPAPDGFLSARDVSVDSHPLQTVAENNRRVEEGSKGAVDLSGKGEQAGRQRRGGASVVPFSPPPPLRPFAPHPGLVRGTSLTGHLLVPFTFVVEGSKHPHHQPYLLPPVPHVPHRAPRSRSSTRRPKNIQPKMPSSQNSNTSDDLFPGSLQIDLREDPVASVTETASDNQHQKAPAKLSKSSVHYSGSNSMVVSTPGEQSGQVSQCSLPSPLQRSRSSGALLVGSNSGESRDPGTATTGGRRKSWEQARKDTVEEKDEVEVTLVEYGTRDITARTTTATTASVLTTTTSTATTSTTPATATTTASVVPAVPMLVPVDSNPQLQELATDAIARSRPPLGPPPSLIPTATASEGKEGGVAGVEDPTAVGRGSFEMDQSGGDGGAPLDLCIKKTDMLTGSRMRANLPVQLVLPQVQPRTTSTTSTPTPLSAPSPDDVIADTKRALKEIQVVIATTSSATVESPAFTTSLTSSAAEDVGVTMTLTTSGGTVVTTPQSVPSFVPANGGGVVTVGVGVSSDVRGTDMGVARAKIAQPWPSVNAAGACVRPDGQGQQAEAQAARNMTSSAENAADLPNDLSMESQASLAPADAAEEERLRHQLKKLEELAARKEQERERLLVMHKRKAEMLMEMESKRRRTGNTSTIATTSNQLPHLDTLLPGSLSTHSRHDNGEHSTSTSSRVGGAAESRPGTRGCEVLQQAMARAHAVVDRSANSGRLNGPTQRPSTAASGLARVDGSVLDLSRPASQDSSSGTSERGPLVQMISQAIQDWGKQKPGRPSEGEDAGPSENGGRGQAGGGAIRSAHQAPKDNCSPLRELGPSPSRAPCFSPYTLRRMPVHEPPVPRFTHSAEAIPQSAHMQRPFQLAGSWIVPADRSGKAQTAERAHAASGNRPAASGTEGQATAIEKTHERGQLEPGERATQKTMPSDRNLQGARGSASVPREVIDLTREQREGLIPSAQRGAGPKQDGCGVRGKGDAESSVQADLAVAVARSHKQASGGGGAGEGPLTDGQPTGRFPQLLPMRPANVHLVPGPGTDFEAAGAARFPPSSTRRSHGQPHPQLQPQTQPHPGLQPARDAMFQALQQQQQGIMMDKTSMAALQQRPSRMHAFPAYPDPRLVPTSTALLNAAALRHPTALGLQRMPVSTVMQRDGRGMDVHPTYPMGRHPASATNTHFPAQSQQGEEQNLVLRNPMEDPPAPRQTSRLMPIAPKSLENVNTAMMQQQQQQQQQLQRQAAAGNMHLQQEAALHMQQHHQLLANHHQQQQQHMQQYPQHGSQKPIPGHPSSRNMQVTHPHSNGPTYPPLSSAPTSDAHVVPMSMTVAAGAGGGPIMSRSASGYYSHAVTVGRGGEMVVQPVTSDPAPSSSSSSSSVTQRMRTHDASMARMLQMHAGGRPPFYPPTGLQPGAMDPNLVRGDPYPSTSQPYPHHLPGHPLQPGTSHPVMMHPRLTSGEGAQHPVKVSRRQQQQQQHLQQQQQQHHHQQQQHQHQQTLRKPEGMCEFCGAAAMYLCSKCRSLWYCSQRCQTSHWTTHGSKCKAKS